MINPRTKRLHSFSTSIALIATVPLFGIFAAIGTSTFNQVADQAQIASSVAPVTVASIEQPEAPAEVIERPAESPQEAPIVPERVTTQPEPQSEPEPAPVLYYAAEMTAAGIPADQQYAARALLVNPDGTWFPYGNSYGVSLAAAEYTAVEKFDATHRYVMFQYKSWHNALAAAEAYGGRW